MRFLCRHEWGQMVAKEIKPRMTPAEALAFLQEAPGSRIPGSEFRTKLVLAVQCKKCGKLRVSEHVN